MEKSMVSKPHVHFEVEKVIGVSSEGTYRVQWAPVWVSSFHLVGCEHLIQEFLQQQQQQQQQQHRNDNTTITQSNIFGESSGTDSQKLEVNPLENDFRASMVQSYSPESREHIVRTNDIKVEIDTRSMRKTSHEPPSLDSVNYEHSSDSVASETSSTHRVAEEKRKGHAGVEQENNNSDERFVPVTVKTEDDDTTERNDAVSSTRKVVTNQHSFQWKMHQYSNDTVADELPSLSNQTLASNHSPDDMLCKNSSPKLNSNDNVNDMIANNELFRAKYYADYMRKNNSSGHKVSTFSPTRQLSSSPTTPFSAKRHYNPHKSDYTIGLNTRMDSSTEEEFSCTQCPKTFTDIADLTHHMRVHADESRFTCGVCHRWFSTKNSLKNHMRVHEDECPFICEICCKVFTIQHDFDSHVLSHRKEEKVFTCTHCGKTFGRKLHLEQHLLTHSTM